MIETHQLCKRYGGFTAVDGIGFRVEPGQVLGFLGPNGAGKSTTMKMIAGFLAPTSGSAKVCGFDVQQQPIEAKRVLRTKEVGIEIRPGDRFEIRSSGGGGWGDPAQRSQAARARDVAQELVSWNTTKAGA